jgi:hypothetical protein
VVTVIRIDTLWLCTQPQDMRAGADRCERLGIPS